MMMMMMMDIVIVSPRTFFLELTEQKRVFLNAYNVLNSLENNYLNCVTSF